MSPSWSPRTPHALDRSLHLGQGADVLEEAAGRLMTWQVHRDSGLRVQADDERVVLGGRVLLRLRLGPLVVPAPCEVVEVVDEPTERGFAYRTLPGHPEDGVEHFLLSLHADGSVHGRVHALATAVGLLARAGGPVTRVLQRRQADLYLRAMRG